MKKRAIVFFTAGFLLFAPDVVLGQSVSVANVEEKSDPAKFFLFYGPGLSKDQVRGDLVYCIDQAKDILSERDRVPSMGLIGALINGRMAEIDRFRMRNAAMRKCMGMMGYKRFAVPQEQWRMVVDKGDIVVDNKGQVDLAAIERMVDFATGPKPAGEELPS